MAILNIKDKHIDDICMMTNELIGNVTSKNLFTGYGLFYNKELMFGLWLNGKFYLQAKDELSNRLINSGCVAFTKNEVDAKFVLSDYYCLTKDILGDRVLLRKLLMLSIKQIQDRKNEIALSKANRLKDLPNLSIKYERMLKKVGIHDVNTLKIVGAENAIVRLRKFGIPATLNTYWKLACALLNKNSEMLNRQQKEILLKKLNKVLYEAGFRRYRKIDDE
ncbi:TfoX/Sxy family DNA transformation protein [Rodentibacter caecimuris]|uniref:DNA transformation protein n=1 Tax=Rodentibacter caecimuris TaxID=1796644 RepID=A0A9X8YWT6_9PAST|nr:MULTISPECIES: TfoX/Sxy family DNA transformation protein [Pasteurellaceae]AOF53040.1 DNA transformation protein TfoX [Pasteurellaceae bacterium NI1060]MCQ9123726.1 TfoX/Sxy family DNA transformation protein [Rodentibacter heylii]MCR1838699.1 TfoX/Sxy family DNA transformation protein [Pasteurella caecimuris]MCU0108149.1 TfoX/Sxy family DNA transformation protein [Pasteurella caecimuris]MCX2962438.1 TfoX/Sxy family DNA transformation protein [Rodentibacter heylii]